MANLKVVKPQWSDEKQLRKEYHTADDGLDEAFCSESVKVMSNNYLRWEINSVECP